MTQTSVETAATFSLAVKFSMPSTIPPLLAEVFESSKLEVQITFFGQDGSALAIIFPLSEALTAHTGARYGG